MNRKDYYLILGVSRDAAAAGIRSAYRDLAHRYHPDRVGDQGTGHFQEINEAYEVLSDPVRRAAYDQEMQESSVRVRVKPGASQSGFASPAPRRRAGPAPEPMIPVAVTGRSAEDALDGLGPSFPELGLLQPRHLEPVTIELHLSPEAARRGGMLTLSLPAFYPCPACQGRGSDWFIACFRCGGTGREEAEELIRISLPPRLRDRDQFQVLIGTPVMRKVALQVMVRVERG